MYLFAGHPGSSRNLCEDTFAGLRQEQHPQIGRRQIVHLHQRLDAEVLLRLLELVRSLVARIVSGSD
jgi:hypothetical protein